MAAKFITLHLLLAGLLFGAWMENGLSLLLASDRFCAVPIIGLLVLAGLGLVLSGKRDSASWLADKIPAVGLILTVVGILYAIKGGPSPTLVVDAGHALVGNLLGIAGYVWVEFVGRVCHDQ